MPRTWLSRLRPSAFTTSIVVTVLLATLLPATGQAARAVDLVTDLGIGLLFFMHGARLSRQAVLAGVTHWRLHLTVFACTFVLFPLLGVAMRPLGEWVLTPDLYLGFLFLCALPSTVQSSIAFTSIARGNVPAAVASASASNMFGVFITPVLVGLLFATEGEGGATLDAVGPIVTQLLVPFVVGHLLRPWIGAFVQRHSAFLHFTDQGAILLVVYSAFSHSVAEGLWRETPVEALVGTFVLSALLLAVVLVLSRVAARKLGFSVEDEIVIVFCGSKKTLASGVPMAKVLFAGHAAGMGPLVLPIIVFHQLQLMACAVLAERYASRPRDEAPTN